MATHRDYWKYMIKIHEYPVYSKERVDWHVLNNIKNQQTFNNQMFWQKWTHNFLPINKIEHLIKKTPSPVCPTLCGCEVENHFHILNCPHASRKTSWDTLEQKLQELYEAHNIDPGLCRVLHNILAPFPFRKQTKTLSISYQAIFDDQMTFGLRSLFLGHFVLAWHHTQHEYLKLNNLPNDKGEARLGITAVGNQLFLHVRNLWDARNNSLHKPDPHAPIGYKRLMLQTQVTDLYEKQVQMLHVDRPLLATPIGEILRLSNTQIKSFLDYTTPLVKHSIKLAEENSTSFQPINHYFPPT